MKKLIVILSILLFTTVAGCKEENSNTNLARSQSKSIAINYKNHPVHPTPEPSTFILLGIGLASLAGYMHWRKK